MKNIFCLNIILILSFILSSFSQAKDEPEQSKKKRIRLPVVAGHFYPGQKTQLSQAVKQYLAEKGGKGVIGKVQGLISPHAGYTCSGTVAATGYRQIDPAVKTVIILAPSHYVGAAKASIAEVDFYRTPLGDIPLSPLAATLRSQVLFSTIPTMHQREHSLEVQLPFLQEMLKEFELVPIIIGQADPKPIAEALLPHLTKDTLVIASSDLSHYYPYQEAKRLDKSCLEAIINYNFSKMDGAEACGKIPILVLMQMAQKKGWKPQLIDYRNSGDTIGSLEEVVGYASIAFVSQEGDSQAGFGQAGSGQAEAEKSKGKDAEKKTTIGSDETKASSESMSLAEKKQLLELARTTLTEVLLQEKKDSSFRKDQILPSLRVKRGCFVTLHKKETLRGCIGTIQPKDELCDCIQENVLHAAFHDPRFSPLQKEEVDQVEIEISVLTLPQRIHFTDAEDLKQKIRPGQDGIILSQGWRKATYLPQVWEQLPQKEKFLESLCHKAGLPSDAWKDTKTEIEVYQAIVFSEPKK